MTPIVAFVVADILVKRFGRKTTSRVLREHPVIATGALAWGVYHVFVEDWSYEK